MVTVPRAVNMVRFPRDCWCLILLLLHQTSVCRPESFQVLGPTAPVVAAVGDDIVLPCSLKPNISAEDMHVEWSRTSFTGIVVHLYQDRKIINDNQIRSYRGRTALFPEELKRGNASLRLTGVRASDEGRYTCLIQQSKQSSYDDASVQVQIKGTEPEILTEVAHRAGWVSLLCESKGWDIQPDLLWLDSEGHSLPAAATETHRDSEDLYNVKRRIIIQDRDTNTVTCRVHLQQRKLEKETVFNITAEMFPAPRWKVSLAVVLPLAAAALIGCAVLTQRYTTRKEQDEFIKAQKVLKTDLKKKYECIVEGLAQQGHATFIKDIYTELYITKRRSEGLSNKQDIRTVLTKGIAGIGKTVYAQKFILNWAEGKNNKSVHFIFTLPFRELNFCKDEELSLIQLLRRKFPQLKEVKSNDFDEVKVIFMFDGLDECRLPLDFQNNEICRDVTKSVSVDVLLTNLIQGNLLPSALLWINSTPEAANQIPPEYVDQVMEIKGFNDQQKEEYFRKKIKYKEMASRIMSHIQSCRSLHLMCHLPVFCWICATVLDSIFSQSECVELPKTLTEMCTHLLFKEEKHHDDNNGTSPNKTSSSDTEMIMKLGELAFEQLEKGKQICSLENLRERDIDVSEVSAYSGLCTEIFKEESGLNQETGYCFVHPSIQEYLAALFVFNSCVKGNISVRTLELTENSDHNTELTDLHKRAVNVASKSENGQLELFLRFLLGLSLDSIQMFLGGLPTQTGSASQSIKETINSIKQKIREESEAGRTMNLFQCLNEINVNALEKEIQIILAGRHEDELEPDQCSALAFNILNSEEVLDDFNFKLFRSSAAGYQQLAPILKKCKKAILNKMELTKKSCEIVASALQSSNSPLIELDLSFNNLGNSEIKLLCEGLKSPNCKLQTLRLGQCTLTDGCCDDLASVLRSPHSELRDLELRDNDLLDSGVTALSAGLENTNCKLEKLGLSGCCVTEKGCDSLASALRKNPSHLRELDLSNNNINNSTQVRAGFDAKQVTLILDPTGESNTPGPREDDCQNTVEPNTANKDPPSSKEDGGDKEKSKGFMQEVRGKLPRIKKRQRQKTTTPE